MVDVHDHCVPALIALDPQGPHAVLTHVLERLCRVDLGHLAGARHFEEGLLLLEHPPQGLWSLHLVPQHPRIHPDVSGRALERRTGCGEYIFEGVADLLRHDRLALLGGWQSQREP